MGKELEGADTSIKSTITSALLSKPVVANLAGHGVEDNARHAIVTIANPQTLPDRINLVGWSRRAVTCLLGGLLVVLTLSIVINGQSSAPCVCADVGDLINRINMAHAAIDKYKAELQTMSPSKKIDAIEPGNTQINRDVLQEAVDDAMGEVKDVKARGGTGSTHGATCKIVSNGDTPCLKSLIEKHEDLHKVTCEKDHIRLKLVKGDNRWDGRLLKDFAEEEIRGYETEIAEAVRRLRAMPPSCRPGDWIGTITVLEIKRTIVTVNSPPKNRFHNGSTKKSDEFLSRWGTIRFNGSSPTATWHTQLKSSSDEVSSGVVSCEGMGGLKTGIPNKGFTNTVHNEVNGTGFRRDAPSVNIVVPIDNTYFEIRFTLPKVPKDLPGNIPNLAEASATGSGYNRKSGGCNPPPDTTIPAHKIPFVMSESEVYARIRVSGDRKYIGGSEMIDMFPVQVVIPGAEMSHRANVSVHLHKVN